MTKDVISELSELSSAVPCRHSACPTLRVPPTTLYYYTTNKNLNQTFMFYNTFLHTLYSQRSETQSEQIKSDQKIKVTLSEVKRIIHTHTNRIYV